MCPVLQLSDVTKRFGEVVALQELSMAVQPGAVHGFVGRNGAGKTTAMRIAMGLATADAGRVLWEGRPATAEDRRRFGYMPEERGLYPKMGAGEQVAFFARLAGLGPADAATAAAAALEAVGVGDRAAEPVERLSLGNQQRCQLAVALVTRPPVLVLDEPFSGLDPLGVDLLAEVLRREVDRGAAVVFSSHQLELVEALCDEVTIVEAGAVVAAGTIGELRRRHTGRRLRVGVEGAGDGWAAAVAGARVLGPAGPGEVLVSLADGADDQAVLAAAVAAGRVTSFRPEEASLAEVFRQVVAR